MQPFLTLLFRFALLLSLLTACAQDTGIAYGSNEISPDKIQEQNLRMTELVRKIEQDLGLEPNSINLTIPETGHTFISEEEWLSTEKQLRESFAAEQETARALDLSNKRNAYRRRQLDEAYAKCTTGLEVLRVALDFPDIVHLGQEQYDTLAKYGYWPPKEDGRKK
ncbi:MAG: hypothetical protein H6555_06270 [Lewinellaceae bacterium]|nr:hypothetical protein [Lewinellaceae bacterium]